MNRGRSALAKNKSHEDEIRKPGLAALREFGCSARRARAGSRSSAQSAVGKRPRDRSGGDLLPRQNLRSGGGRSARRDRPANHRQGNQKRDQTVAVSSLAQKGLVAPQEKAAETKPAAPYSSASARSKPTMSAVDGGGGRLIWIAKPQPSHGLQVIQAMLHDREGLAALRRHAHAAQRAAQDGRRDQATTRHQHDLDPMGICRSNSL